MSNGILILSQRSASATGISASATALYTKTDGNLYTSTIDSVENFIASGSTVGTSGSRTFYSASASGGAVSYLNTITLQNGVIVSWTQA